MPRPKMDPELRVNLSTTVSAKTKRELAMMRGVGESLGQVIDRLLAQRSIAQKRSVTIK